MTTTIVLGSLCGLLCGLVAYLFYKSSTDSREWYLAGFYAASKGESIPPSMAQTQAKVVEKEQEKKAKKAEGKKPEEKPVMYEDLMT